MFVFMFVLLVLLLLLVCFFKPFFYYYFRSSVLCYGMFCTPFVPRMHGLSATLARIGLCMYLYVMNCISKEKRPEIV